MSDAMETGTVVRWFKNVGDQVSAGEVIGELETDKAGVELESPVSGTVARIFVAEGSENVPVGELLIVVDSSAQPEAATSSGAVDALASEDLRHRIEEVEHIDESPIPSDKGQPGVTSTAAHDHDIALAEHDSGDAIAATPLARAMAEIAGIQLSSITHAGRADRVTRRHVEERLGLTTPHRESSILSEQSPSIDLGLRSSARISQDTTIQPHTTGSRQLAHTGIRKLIAARMTESKQNIPHFYLSIECDVSSVGNLLDRLRPEKLETRITFTCFAIKANAAAIRQVPAVNSRWTPDQLTVMDEINIAVGVATESGLLAPVIRNADRKTLREIAAELHELVERGKNGRLRPQDTGGGTFTISNLGMFGVESLFPIITPGQSCVLGLGALRETPVVREGRVALGKVMTATLSGDHRAIDGAQGADFLRTFKMLVDEPARILL